MSLAVETRSSILLCGSCGYDLRGIASNRCPECGRMFDPTHLIDQLIPWEQRRRIGRTKAFFRTAAWATFRPGRLAEKLDHPIDRTAAAFFLAATCLLMTAALAAAAAAIRFTWDEWFVASRPPPNYTITLDFALLKDTYAYVLTGIAVALSTAITLALVDLYFHCPTQPSERRHRALALARYTSGPIALTSLCVVGASAAFMKAWDNQYRARALGEVMLEISTLLVCAFPIVWIWRVIRKRRGIPMKLAIFTIIFGLVGWILTRNDYSILANTLVNVAAQRMTQVLLAGAFAGVVLWWINAVRLMKLATGSTSARALRMAITLPLIWAGVLVLTLLTLHAIYFVATLFLLHQAIS